MIRRDDKIAASREIALWKNVFPKAHRTTGDDAGKADHEIAVMVAILHDYIGPEPSLTANEREAT